MSQAVLKFAVRPRRSPGQENTASRLKLYATIKNIIFKVYTTDSTKQGTSRYYHKECKDFRREMGDPRVYSRGQDRESMLLFTDIVVQYEMPL